MKIGSIERAKLTDLAVLDRDYFDVPDVEIKKIRVGPDDCKMAKSFMTRGFYRSNFWSLRS